MHSCINLPIPHSILGAGVHQSAYFNFNIKYTWVDQSAYSVSILNPGVYQSAYFNSNIRCRSDKVYLLKMHDILTLWCLDRWSTSCLDIMPALQCLARWSAPFWNRIPRLWGFGKMECIYLEQNTHTLRFRKDGVHLSRMKYPHSEIFKRWSAVSRMEYPHSEVLERWSALSRMEMPTLRGFGKMEFTFQTGMPTLWGFGKMECTF